jgi:hypothetical protein
VESFVVRRAQRVNILFARSIKVITFIVDYHTCDKTFWRQTNIWRNLGWPCLRFRPVAQILGSACKWKNLSNLYI